MGAKLWLRGVFISLVQDAVSVRRLDWGDAVAMLDGAESQPGSGAAPGASAAADRGGEAGGAEAASGGPPDLAADAQFEVGAGDLTHQPLCQKCGCCKLPGGAAASPRPLCIVFRLPPCSNLPWGRLPRIHSTRWLG